MEPSTLPNHDVNEGLLHGGTSRPSNNRQSPPPPPDSDENFGNLLQLDSSQIPYIFGTRIHMTIAMKEKETKFKDSPVLAPIYLEL